MKKLLTLILVVSLFSCTKKIDNRTCYICKWNPDQTGYVRPNFTICGEDNWMSMATFKDERGNDIGGRCDKR